VVIAGPTATGKSQLAIRLALAIRDLGRRVEIIGADSRQVYRAMDIGTAKVPLAERSGIPHHGLDLVDPDEPFSVANFARHAREVLTSLAGDESSVAVLVGGTGLYLRAVTCNIDTEALPADQRLRATVERELAASGLPAAAQRLTVIAPRLASRVDLHNPRRVARALEIALLRGDTELPEPRTYPGKMVWIGLALDPATNREWISRRARSQFESGLLGEAAALRARYGDEPRSFSAFGYREAFAVLDGRMDLEDAIAEDVRRTAAFARRQRTWFRSEPGIGWLNAANAPIDPALERVRAALDERAGPTPAS
jgi:tRNA dimethylallyltransferase